MSEAVRLTVVPDAAHVVPGGRVSLSLTVQNTGGDSARYHVAVGGIPEAWCELDKRHLTLGPGGQEQVQLTVQPPPGTATAAGSYPLTVRVTSEPDPSIRVATVVALTVGTEDGLTMDVAPADVEGREACFQITYLNLSDAPVAVALVARDNENGLRFSSEPDAPVIVPAGGGGPVTVHVVPKMRKTIGESHPYEIEFRGVQLGTEQAANPLLVRRARFVYVPRYTVRYLPMWLRRVPGWALLLLFVLLLLALAGGRTLASPAARTAVTPTPAPTRAVSSVQPTRPRAAVQGVTMSRPSIRRFTLVHRRRGQPYELVWQTRGGAHVTLDGRPVSARGSLVLRAPLHSATYRLAATNGARRATARLHVVVDALTTDTHAFVLTTANFATFAVHRRKGELYVIWLVRNAVHVRLQGRLVAHAGEGLVPPGASWLRLVASNDVGIRQRLLHLARPMPTATPRPRPTATPVLRPTATSTPQPTATPTLRPTGTATPTLRPTGTATPTLRPTGTPTSTPRPTGTPTPRPTGTPTPHPTMTPTAQPTRTPTPRATAVATRRPTVTPLPLALRTIAPSLITTPPPLATVTPTPSVSSGVTA